MLSLRRLSFDKLLIAQDAPRTAAASAVMTRNVTYCHPGDPLHDVLSKMKVSGFVQIPIVDRDSKPCGVLNARDALPLLLGEVECDVSLLRDYVIGIGYR